MNFRKAITFIAACALALGSGLAAAKNLMISSGLGQQHFWVSEHMQPFANTIEEKTDISFTRFYAGSLVSIGRELDALKGGTIHVAAPLLAPYHEGRFPLSDVTQLPMYGTDSVMVTRAFQRLLDSDVELVDGKTFYEYELGDKGLKAWGVSASAPYAMSTTGEELRTPSDLKGLPMRAGAALHTIVLQQLGATPVTMPAAQAYEALSRGTIDGIILSVSDWTSYSLQDLLKYTITGVSLGHWESYLAMTEKTWQELSPAERETWDKVARDVALESARSINQREKEVREMTKAKGARFVSIDELPPKMGSHVAKAATDTWKQWIQQMEDQGHPGKATAKLWADLITAEGGTLPKGVEPLLR